MTSTLTGEVETVRVDSSLTILGRGSQCDLRLMHPDVSRRHACLHLLRDRVLCVDLGSRTGVSWDGQRRVVGWLDAETPVRIGPFELRLAAPARLRGDDGPIEAETFFCRQPIGQSDLAGAGVRFLSHTDFGERHVPLGRPITLVGRGEQCKLRLRDESVSRVHSSLMLTPEGAWVADLLGRGGVRVNGEAVSLSRLSPGDELQIGRYRMQFDVGLSVVDEEPSGSSAVIPAIPAGPNASGVVSESLLLAVTETFADMQRQMSEQFRMQMEMMVGLIESMRKEMNGEIRAELARLVTIGEEIRDAQRKLSQESLPADPAPAPAASSRRSTSKAVRTSAHGGASGDGASRGGVAEHAFLTQRLRELERERTSHWVKLVGLLKRDS